MHLLDGNFSTANAWCFLLQPIHRRLILRFLVFLTEPVPRRGYYNKGPYDADAEAVMAKTHWERMEEQELTGMPSHDKPSHDNLPPSVPNVPHEVPTAMNVGREHVFETDDVENERESKAPRLIAHEEEDGPFMMEEGIIEAMEEYDVSLKMFALIGNCLI